MSEHFDDLSVFVMVVQRGSMARAAEALSLSAPVVTKRIQALETRLGASLLTRSTRRLAPTALGQQLYDEVLEPLRRIADAEERTRNSRERVEGQLRVIMPTYFASSGFHHRVIPAYLAAHPAVHLTLTIASDPRAHLDEDFDLLVAGKLPHEQFPESRRVRRKLLEFRGAVYATPGYLAEHGVPKHPTELSRHNCLSYMHRDWYFEASDRTPIVVPTRGTLTTNSNAMLYAGTMNGLGLAYSFPYFFEQELQAGRVVEVLADFTKRSFIDIEVFFPATRHLPKRTRAFLDMLVEHFAPKAKKRKGSTEPR